MVVGELTKWKNTKGEVCEITPSGEEIGSWRNAGQRPGWRHQLAGHRPCGIISEARLQIKMD